MPRPSGKSHGHGHGHGRGHGSKAAEQAESRETTVSKAMSFVLRHGAVREGLVLDENGYANVKDLVGFFFFF